MKNIVTQQLQANELIATCETLLRNGGSMQMAYAWFPEPNGLPEVLYLAMTKAPATFVLWRCYPDENKTLPSLTNISPMLGWYEREMTDLFGLHFHGHPEPYPLVLHEGASPQVAPMDPQYPTEMQLPFTTMPWHLPEIINSNIQQIPFGPVRAAITESAQFTFFYAGEAILHFHQRLFFKHRGMEKRFHGLTPELGVILAERVSGVSSVAHALAFCQAVETACGCIIPERAAQLRVLLAELERLYNHLHYLAHLCHTTTLKVGEVEGKLLTERVKQLNAQLTGSRFLREILTPGGLRRDLDVSKVSAVLTTLQRDIDRYVKSLIQTGSYLDRLIDTGLLPTQVAIDEAATGPVARASNLDHDFRRDHPYAAYLQLAIVVATHQDGDAYARMRVRMAEINISMALMQQLLTQLNLGPIRNACTTPCRVEGLGWAESARGGLYYAVHLDDEGKLARVKIKSSSFSNWRVFPFTVDDTNMMDYAINEASFGLTIAGCDR